MEKRNNRMISLDYLPDFICASLAKHSAAADLASSVGETRSISIRIPHPIAVLTDCFFSVIKPEKATS